jgi:hypothetical protein
VCVALYDVVFFSHRLMGAFACTARFASRGRTGLVVLDARVFCLQSIRASDSNRTPKRLHKEVCRTSLFAQHKSVYSGICPAVPAMSHRRVTVRNQFTRLYLLITCSYSFISDHLFFEKVMAGVRRIHQAGRRKLFTGQNRKESYL